MEVLKVLWFWSIHSSETRKKKKRKIYGEGVGVVEWEKRERKEY